jgi:NADPH-dependent 2,4-dienoyl-CoA reductase/sulfur reductase-like enzyme
VSAAARARCLDEHAEIIVREQGHYVSFANCGLPYHLSGEIGARDDLILHTPESLAASLNPADPTLTASEDTANSSSMIAPPPEPPTDIPHRNVHPS